MSRRRGLGLPGVFRSARSVPVCPDSVCRRVPPGLRVLGAPPAGARLGGFGGPVSARRCANAAAAGPSLTGWHLAVRRPRRRRTQARRVGPARREWETVGLFARPGVGRFAASACGASGFAAFVSHPISGPCRVRIPLSVPPILQLFLLTCDQRFACRID